MFETEDLKIWNLTPGIDTFTGPQEIFNIVGNLNFPEKLREFNYSLNNRPEKQVFFKSSENGSARLEKPGDFNIDTIRTDELQPKNNIRFNLIYHSGLEKNYELSFPVNIYNTKLPSYKLNLDSVDYTQEVGQIVDGNWRVSKDEKNEKCIEILEKDAGFDRIILFGRYNWTSGYEVTARIFVTSWTHITHNIGLLFKWNPHQQGDGTNLPMQWTTGLGYYYSLSKGLRIRFGQNVYVDSNGQKHGDYILMEKPISFLKYIKQRILKLTYPFLKNGSMEKTLNKSSFSQIQTGKHYYFKMRVHPESYRLTVWEQGLPEPSPQLVVDNPNEILKQGSVGVIAYNCGVRIYEYNVNQI